MGSRESLDDEDHNGLYDDKDNAKHVPLEFFQRKDQPLRHSRGSQTGVAKDTPSDAHDLNKPVDSAVTKLRQLGVDVFDQTVNADLSWDCLAGYDHVKQEIEETIVNSLKYPGDCYQYTPHISSNTSSNASSDMWISRYLRSNCS